MSDKQETIKISKDIYDRIFALLPETEYKSVDDYVSFILEEVMDEIEEDEDVQYSEEDEKKVKDRLKALGYLD